MNNKIAVFGCGFVGGTVADFLEQHDVEVTRVDPKLYPENDPVDAIVKADGIIICVPTPSKEDGSCDDKHIKEVLKLCNHKERILLKSTVTPDLLQTYDDNVVYNPEFLRERHAKSDFANQPVQIFGYHMNNKEDAMWWAEIFAEIHTNPIETVYTNRQTASMIKYVHNAFLATKVAWFHEMYKTLPPEVNYEAMISTLGMFERIGNNHMQAPNHNNLLGYGGACFPKDVSALTKIIDHSILKYVHMVNTKLNKLGEVHDR
tara:strand:+ start:31966 stop:32748 length:783 start_codon:yes stop_codon:yes gene_type:complete